MCGDRESDIAIALLLIQLLLLLLFLFVVIFVKVFKLPFLFIDSNIVLALQSVNELINITY